MQQATIGRLSDKILLKIFRNFLGVSPRDWPRLAHVCREWRRIVFASQDVLHLRLFCTHGTPVLTTLHCWPILPIIVQFGGVPDFSSPVPRDWGHIVAALKQPRRVSSISLTVTKSLLQKVSTFSEPFSELEELVLLPQVNLQLSLPLTFQWGTRLRKLHTTRIDFPSFLWRLVPSRNLVDIQLYGISDSTYMPPELFLTTLSQMTHLQSLSLHFLSSTNHTSILSPWTVESVHLPSLTRLNFRGMSEYLTRLVATLDAPYLEDIKVVFPEYSTSNLSKLSKFINRIEIHKSHRQARILSSEHAISISLIQPGASIHFELELLHKPLDVQLYHMTHIRGWFSDLLFDVEDLRVSMITTMHPIRGRESYTYSRLWLDLIKSFGGVKWFHVSGNLWGVILQSLHLPDNQYETVLPALYKLYTPQPGPREEPLREVVVSVMTSRWLSGHPIAVEYERQYDVNEDRETGAMYDQCQGRYVLTWY